MNKVDKKVVELQKYVAKKSIIKALLCILGASIMIFCLSNSTFYFLSGNILNFGIFISITYAGYVLLIISDKGFDNYFIFISIFMAIFIFYGSIFFISQSEKDLFKFPFYPKFESKDNIFINDAKCESILFPTRDIPTENDVFYCMMHIENRNVNESFNINIEIEDFYVPLDNSTLRKAYCYFFNDKGYNSFVNNSESVECLLKTSVGNVGTHDKRIRFKFISTKDNKEIDIISYFTSFRYNSLTESQYKEIKNNTTTLFFSGIIASFSSVYFVKNFMEVWDRKTKPKRKKCPKCGKMNEVE
ncbi:MAG: hypothetical protein WA139_01175 [Candidatus Aenigmatarchaeota archaeon]